MRLAGGTEMAIVRAQVHQYNAGSDQPTESDGIAGDGTTDECDAQMPIAHLLIIIVLDTILGLNLLDYRIQH
jgi:hypothetical protein